MPRVLLFGPLAEAASARSVQLDASTVGEVLDVATRRFGNAFADLLASSSVWVNGEDASTDRKVTDDDEIALLPPMSGG